MAIHCRRILYICKCGVGFHGGSPSLQTHNLGQGQTMKSCPGKSTLGEIPECAYSAINLQISVMIKQQKLLLGIIKKPFLDVCSATRGKNILYGCVLSCDKKFYGRTRMMPTYSQKDKKGREVQLFLLTMAVSCSLVRLSEINFDLNPPMIKLSYWKRVT